MFTHNTNSKPRVLAIALLILFGSISAFGQGLSANERETGLMMLHRVKDEIKKNYYDPNFQGVDLDALFKAQEEKLKQATSNGQMFGIIAQAMLGLNDSHTFFLPPRRAAHFDYGLRTAMIGDQCYIVAVKPGSDAESKGLKAGDIVHLFDGYKPTRANSFTLSYLYYSLRPVPTLNLTVQSPGEQPRKVEFNAAIRQDKKLLDLTSDSGNDLFDLIREEQEYDRINAQRFQEYGDQLVIWKMPQFDMSKDEVDAAMAKLDKFKYLIIDLRGNGGGYVDTLLRIIGQLFDRDVKIGDIKQRKETKPFVAKTRGTHIYHGKLTLLVDSNSASASELLARVVQLEKRGNILGDRTEGAVMRARHYSLQIGVDRIIPYGASITDADIIMTDGVSLERTGVTPDEVMLPTGADMRAESDPVLSYAASLAGVKLDPAQAGALFPIRWKLKP
jgi:carboxyl-terminal processing protease